MRYMRYIKTYEEEKVKKDTRNMNIYLLENFANSIIKIFKGFGFEEAINFEISSPTFYVLYYGNNLRIRLMDIYMNNKNGMLKVVVRYTHIPKLYQLSEFLVTIFDKYSTRFETTDSYISFSVDWNMVEFILRNIREDYREYVDIQKYNL